MIRRIFISFTGMLLFSLTNAQVWNKLGVGLAEHSEVTCLKQIDSVLYIAGSPQVVGEGKRKSLCLWNGQNLDTLPTLLSPQSGYEYCIEKFNGEVILGGAFDCIAMTYYSNDPTKIPGTNLIAKWNGTEWSSLGGGFKSSGNYQINSLMFFENNLFVAGSVSSTSTLNGVHGFVRWDGTHWNYVNSGLPGIKDMVVFNGELHLGGIIFQTNNGDTLLGVARWTGSGFENLGKGLYYDVFSMTVDTINNFLYAGGAISYIGYYGVGTPLYSSIIRWDGYQYDSVGINPKLCRQPLDMALYHNNLYTISYGATGMVTDTIMTRFDGHQWYRVEGPVTTTMCLETFNNELIVGGAAFITTSGDTAYGAARYYAPPDTISCLFIRPLIHAMPFGTKEVADTIYTTAPYHIQFYTNNKYASSWTWDFGDGGTANTREPEHTFAAPGTYNVALEVIHPHNLSSQVCTLNVAKTITIIDNTAVKETEKNTIEYLGQNIPNPFSKTTEISYYVPWNSTGKLQIHNLKGKLFKEFQLNQGHSKLEITFEDYESGSLLYSIIIGGRLVQTKRMIFIKE